MEMSKRKHFFLLMSSLSHLIWYLTQRPGNWHLPSPLFRHQHCIHLWFFLKVSDFFLIFFCWISCDVWLRDLAYAFILMQASTLLPLMISSWFFLDFIWCLTQRPGICLHLDSGINAASTYDFFLKVFFGFHVLWLRDLASAFTVKASPWFRHQQCSTASDFFLNVSDFFLIFFGSHVLWLRDLASAIPLIQASTVQRCFRFSVDFFSKLSSRATASQPCV